MTHRREQGAHVSTIALVRPHPLCCKFGAAGFCASSLSEAGPTPPLRPGWLPAAPPTFYPRPPRRGTLPAGRRLTRRAVPHFPAAASPRHGPGPRLTMAAARHSTLDFMLGTKGEDVRPPPARSPLSPGGLGPGGKELNNARCGTMCTGGRVEAALGLAPCTVRAAVWGLQGPRRVPQPSSPLGPGSPSSPLGGTPVGRVCRGGGETRRGWRGATRVTFSCFLGRVNPPPGDGDSPHGSTGWGKDHAALAKFLGDCVGDGSPGKGPGTGKGNDYYLGWGG